MNKKWYAIHWYEWIGWAIWLVVTVIFIQNAFASVTEVAPRAALISWLVTAFLVLFAAIIWGRRILAGSTK